MGDHAIGTPRPESSATSAAPSGAPFFAPHEVAQHGGEDTSARPFPWVDQDQTPEPQRTPQTRIDDTKDVVTWAFVWISRDVEERLEELEADLRAADQPSFGEQLLRAAFRVALSAATAGASEHLAGLVVGASDALKELVKSAIENSVGEAIAVGANAFAGSREPLTAFINAQKSAARHLYQRAQTRWLREGRHRVTTQTQADVLAAGLTEARVKTAADHHYRASRDAWVSYLAQSRFGVHHAKVMNEDYDLVDAAPSTNLAGDRERRRARLMGEDVETDSPDLAAAFLGAADGVFVAEAELPAIAMIDDTGYYGMTGRPVVTHAYLNEVNSIIRGQYQGRPLADANIPRVVRCTVADGDSFTIRVNEKGVVFHRDELRWLRSRALASRPWNMGKPDELLEQIGLELLLADLVPTKISKGTSE